MHSDRNKLLAFLLNLIPGLGFMYWGRAARAVIYPLLFFGTAVGSFMLAMVTNEQDLLIFGALFAAFFWGISMLDMVIVLLRTPSAREAHYRGYGAAYGAPPHQGAAYQGAYMGQQGPMEQMNEDELHQHPGGEYGHPEGPYGQPMYQKAVRVNDSSLFCSHLFQDWDIFIWDCCIAGCPS